MRRTLRIVVPLLVLVAVLYGGRMLWLTMMATEVGDVPAISEVDLPSGAEVLGTSTVCGSGGCWLEATIRPPAGTTPEVLAAQLGAEPQLRIPGDLLDPRVVSVRATPEATTLHLQLDYFSPPDVP